MVVQKTIVGIRRFAFIALLFGAAASAQDRVVAPLPSLAPLVEDIAPAVVNISIRGTVARNNPFAGEPLIERFFGPQPGGERPFQAAGSGVIVDADEGFILTNYHVVENADEITISLTDNREFVASVIGSDRGSDLAVLRIEADSLTEIGFAATDDLRVGDYVVAIGNPLGLTSTVTAGIVSALGRGIGRDPDAYEDFIQTDASINVGNSGGALVNLRGELVGVNSAIISQTGGNIGIGLAIPADMARAVMEQIVEFGSVQHGFLGVSMQTVSPRLAEDYGLGTSEGALVMSVEPGSAAEIAGIEIEDVIVGVEGEPVANGNELRNLIGLRRPGESVDVEIMRGGERMTIAAVLGTREETALSEVIIAPDEPLFEGVELVEDQLRGTAGLVVASVAEGSPSALQGLLEGDLITAINRERVTTLEEARAVVESADSIVVQVERGTRNILIRLR